MYSRGGTISNYQDSNSLATQSLREIHIDKRVLPLMNDELTQNISISDKFYQQIPPSQPLNASLGVSQNVNFRVNGMSDSLISMSESYFRVNLEVTQAKDIPVTGGGPSGPSSANFALMPEAGDFFLDDIKTKLNGIDVSDTHSQGLYGVSAFYKDLLGKPRERLAVAQIIPSQESKTNAKVYLEQTPENEDVSAPTDLCGIGYAYDTVDDVMVNPGQPIYSVLSGGASAEVFDGAGCWVANHNAIYMKNLCTTYKNNGGYSQDTGLPPVGNVKTYVEFLIYPRDGMWRTANYLPSNMEIDIQCIIAQIYKWCMIATTDPLSLPTVVIKKFSLMLCRVKPFPDVMSSINSVLLETKKFTYKILNSRVEQIIIPQQTGAGNISFSSVLSGIVPNVVMISFVTQGAFEKKYIPPTPFADAAEWVTKTTQHWLDCHTMSSGAYRKMNIDVNPLTGTGGTDNGIPQIGTIYIECGSRRIPFNQIGYTNYNVDRETQTSLQQSYEAYRKCCVDYDKPFLTYKHWLNQFTVYTFNLTNNDNGLSVGTDETQKGSLTISIEFLDKSIAQFMLVAGLYYSEVDISDSRGVTRIGY